MRKILLAASAALLAACGAAPEEPRTTSEATVRQVAEGELIGYEADNGAYVWRGVPFAAAPEGDLRWRAPRAAAAWDGRREALDDAPRCLQMSKVYDRDEGIDAGVLIGDEDCLYLNVFAPPGEAVAPRPVMMWIHGGGNTWGRAAGYNGAKLAVNEDVIVVAPQYRLGPLGWFAHGALREDAEIPLDASANFGTLDLIQALTWIKDNIATFGGDPNNVTIFGESAGGHNVVTMLASPYADGLFHRAIIQSGMFDSVSLADAENGADQPNAAGKIADRLGVADAAALRGVSLQDLFDAYELDEWDGVEPPRVISDDPVLPTATVRQAFADTATFNVTPIITGTNKDEMKLFQALDPRLVNQFAGVFIWPKDRAFYDALSTYQSRVWRARSVDEPGAMMAEAGHSEVYGYRFDWDEGGKFLVTDFGVLFGAAHAMEIPFVFNHFEFFGDSDRIVFAGATKESREALASEMGAYWAAFARSGDPNAGRNGAPQWPTLDGPAGTRLMRFDSAADGGNEAIVGAESFEGVLADLAVDDSIDAAQKCLIAEAIEFWAPERIDEIAAAVSCG